MTVVMLTTAGVTALATSVNPFAPGAIGSATAVAEDWTPPEAWEDGSDWPLHISAAPTAATAIVATTAF